MSAAALLGGAFGAIMTGFLATKVVNPAGGNGLLFGNPMQVVIQIAAVLASAIWAFVMTVILLKIVDKIMGLRVTPEEEELGLDICEHGEYAFWLE